MSLDEAMFVMLHRLLILVSVFIALILGIYFSRPNRQAALLSPSNPDELLAIVPNGGMIVRASELNFGHQSEASWLPHSIEIFNPTNQTIDITGFLPMCSCSFRNKPISIRPGESAQLNLNFQLTPRDSKATRPPIRYHRRTVVPVIKQYPGKHPGWTITGTSSQTG